MIAGVIIHEAQWHGIASELDKLRFKPEFSVYGEIKWRFFGPENSDPKNPVQHLDQAARDAFRTQFFEIITRRKSVKIVACVAQIEAAYSHTYVHDEEDLYHYTYKPVSERFQYFLQDMSRSIGQQQLGIVVCDHRGKKQDDLLRRHHHKMVEGSGDYISSYDNYIETIFMTPSHRSVGIQFADMVAGAIGRAVNSKDETYFKQIQPSFRASSSGKIDGYGLVKFPSGWRQVAGWGPPSLTHSGASPAPLIWRIIQESSRGYCPRAGGG